jgi:flavin-dependent dehydrogenase
MLQVLVVGSGPAGLSAAIAARRAGADTMLLERFGCFGGVITTVGMETLGWYRFVKSLDITLSTATHSDHSPSLMDTLHCV